MDNRIMQFAQFPTPFFIRKTEGVFLLIVYISGLNIRYVPTRQGSNILKIKS